jgi:HNH endonuclease
MSDAPKWSMLGRGYQVFFTKFDPINDGCWIWKGNRRLGYGRCKIKYKYYSAHRVSYELFIGPIPEGLELDHLCRNPACINPWHLEPVTRKVNVQRGDAWMVTKRRALARTHCKQGHEFTPENTLSRGDKEGRKCRRCDALRHQAGRRQRRLEKEAQVNA